MTGRGGYTMGWLAAVVALYVAHEVGGVFGAGLALLAYGAGATYVDHCLRRAEQRERT